jgi:hypothetical protein
VIAVHETLLDVMRGCVEKIRLSHQISEVKRARTQAKKRTVCLNQAALAHRFRGLSASWQSGGGPGPML